MMTQSHVVNKGLSKLAISLLISLPILGLTTQKSLALPLSPILQQVGYQVINDLFNNQSSSQSSPTNQELAGTIGANPSIDSNSPNYTEPNYEQGYPSSPQPNYQQGYPSSPQPNYQQGYPAYPQPNYQQGYPAYPQPNYQQGYPAYPQPNYQQGYPNYPQPNYQQGYPAYPMMYPFYPPMRNSPPVIINNF
ncbi:hypothetical protein [Nodularia sp. LEGE 04288]|uniref:hypothetical protein n=1 Tax=Nodularia sp. LEGE 04288 TaxID=1828639 RepID=UPI001D125345|nr:hypothetical protein [Nodularia sp. LEGE 04288]MCC2694866.1 hypothetical protein [Nodularia sp. LEGE 04288]